jgi:hypothetical protein
MTNDQGEYSFTDVIPGIIDDLEVNEYTISASSLPEYSSQLTIFPEEGKTEILNISIGLAPVGLSGTTLFEGERIEDIQIDFIPDNSVENNTAVENSVTSLKSGSWGIHLTPGSYNISVLQMDGSTTVYTYEGYITIGIGESPEDLTINLDKKSATVTGETSYDNNPIENITISFIADTSVGNNSAISMQTMSNSEGVYTVELAPGTYEVEINELIEDSDVNGKNLTYNYIGSLVILQGETTKSFNIVMTREET